jgi:hypothetical protein
MRNSGIKRLNPGKLYVKNFRERIKIWLDFKLGYEIIPTN